MIPQITRSAVEFLDKGCENIGGNSFKQVLWAGTGLVAVNTVGYIAKPICDSCVGIGVIVLAINAIALLTLLKNGFQWRNVLILLIGITILSKFNIERYPEASERQYEEREIKNLGYLKYEADSKSNLHPTVTLLTKVPYEKGTTLGELTPLQTKFFYKKIMGPLTVFAQMFSGDTTGKWLDQKIQRDDFTIPEAYREEMRGIADSVTKWCVANNDPFRLTYEQVLRVHCFTDTYKMGSIGLNGGMLKYIWNAMFGDFGCSTVALVRDGEMGIARTLDWPGMGLGKYGFIRRDTLDDGQITQSHIYPGLVAVGTGIKINNGNVCFTTIVNECPIRSTRGIPCGLWARQCLEMCSSVTDVRNFIDTSTQAASSFHFLVADGSEAVNYQIHPREDQYYLARELSEEGNLIITNHFLEPDTHAILDNLPPAGTSETRFCKLSRLLKNDNNSSIEQLAARCLRAVNVPYTLSAHIIKFGPVENSVQTVIADAWASNKIQ